MGLLHQATDDCLDHLRDRKPVRRRGMVRARRLSGHARLYQPACGPDCRPAVRGNHGGMDRAAVPDPAGVSWSSVIMSTDVPLLLCWAAALYCLFRLLDREGSPGPVLSAWRWASGCSPSMRWRTCCRAWCWPAWCTGTPLVPRERQVSGGTAGRRCRCRPQHCVEHGQRLGDRRSCRRQRVAFGTGIQPGKPV